MKRHSQLSPQAVSRLLQEAAESWTRQDYSRTIELLQRASWNNPGNARLLLDLARAHGLRYDYPAAEKCFERAAKLFPQPAELFLAAGRCCVDFGHDEMAGQYFERACLEKSAPLSALLSVAELHQRRSRLNDAAQFLERAAAAFPNDPRLWMAQARLKKLLGSVAEAEPLLRAALASPVAEEPLLIHARYELASVLDQQGRYDEAMAALLEAKAIQQRHAAPFAAQLKSEQARLREMEQTIFADVLSRWRKTDLQPQRRIAFLCGHPRSGTTLLEQMLDAHPEMIASEETHVFHDEAYLPLTRGFPTSMELVQVLDSAAPERLRRSREDYFRCTELYLRKSIGEKMLVDKNPILTALVPAMVRIFPESRILVALRDPRDVCVSCFMQHLGLNSVSSSYLTLEGTVNQFNSLMGFWLNMKPRVADQALEIRYEQLIADPASVCRTVLDFLKISWDPSVLKYDAHARTKRVRSPSYAEVVKPIYQSAAGRWRNYQRHLEPYLQKLEPMVKALGYE